MSMMVLVLGDSKNGKSASLRKLKKEDTFIVMPHAKKVYVKGSKRFDSTTKQGNVIVNGDIMKIPAIIKAVSTKPEYKDFKTLVIDDINYFLQTYVLDREGGPRGGDSIFQTYRSVALYFHNIVKSIKESRDDLIVVIMGHTEISDTGKVKLKSVGSMSDKLISIEGTTDWIIEAKHVKGKVENCDYILQTRGDSFEDSASIPFDVELPQYIENDLSIVLDKVREDLLW